MKTTRLPIRLPDVSFCREDPARDGPCAGTPVDDLDRGGCPVKVLSIDGHFLSKAGAESNMD